MDHAFDGRGVAIEVKLRTQENGKIRLRFSDNGKGLPAEPGTVLPLEFRGQG